MHRSPLHIVVAVAIGSLAAITVAPTSAVAGAYLGGGLAWHQIRGEFDDTLLLAGADALYDVPNVDPGMGPRFVLGFGEGVAFELSYARTRHSAPGLLRPDGYSTLHHVLGMDLVGRTHWGERITAGRARLFTRLGLAIVRLRLDDSGYDLSPQPFDVEYEGGGFTLGGGGELTLHPKLRATLEIDYRFVRYHHALSRGDELELEDSLTGNGAAAHVGIQWWPR